MKTEIYHNVFEIMKTFTDMDTKTLIIKENIFNKIYGYLAINISPEM